MQDTDQIDNGGTTFGSDHEGIREAAAARTRDLAERGPTPVEDHDDSVPDSDLVEIKYTDGRPADEPLKIRDAARDLSEYRRQQREQEQHALAELTGDEQPTTAEAIERAQQAAERAKQAAAEIPAPEQQRATPEQTQQLYEIGLATALHQLRAVAGAEFSDIKSQEDLARLAATDPARFQRLQQLDATWQGTAKNALQALAFRQQEAVESFKQFAQKNDEIAAQRIPETQGPERAAFEQQAMDMLKAHGFERAELAASWTGRDTFSLRDARVQAVVADATRYRQMLANARNVQARPTPPVQRPGAGGVMNRSNGGEIEQLSVRLQRTGKLQDAVRLRAAENAARRK